MRLLSMVQFRTLCFGGRLGSVILLEVCKFCWGEFWRPTALALSLVLDLRVRIPFVVPFGLRPCGAWVYKNLNFLLVPSRFSSPPTGLRLDIAGALLTKRVPRFALPSTTIFDDSDIEDYLPTTILERVWLL